jgi:hypothetical protein
VRTILQGDASCTSLAARASSRLACSVKHRCSAAASAFSVSCTSGGKQHSRQMQLVGAKLWFYLELLHAGLQLSRNRLRFAQLDMSLVQLLLGAFCNKRGNNSAMWRSQSNVTSC